MCYECSRAKDWLAPPRSVRAELAFQSARLSGAECPRCFELRLELEELRVEQRILDEAARHYYDNDRDPDDERVDPPLYR